MELDQENHNYKTFNSDAYLRHLFSRDKVLLISRNKLQNNIKERIENLRAQLRPKQET